MVSALIFACWMYFYFQIRCQHLNIVRIYILTHIPSFSRKPEELARQGPYSHMATVSSGWMATDPLSRRQCCRISQSSPLPSLCSGSFLHYLLEPRHLISNPVEAVVREHWRRYVTVSCLRHVTGSDQILQEGLWCLHDLADTHLAHWPCDGTKLAFLPVRKALPIFIHLAVLIH